MSLTRFYPTPSDRMAIIWSLTPIRDAVVLEYGPAGTTHFGNGLYNSLGIKTTGTLFTTHISEDDIVMGDVSRLENAILEVDRAYQPKLIFVVASAVIAVIGSDIAGVCQYMRQRVNARLISFEEGGFRGDYTYGLRSVYRMLAREVVQSAPRRDRTYNILGASAGSYRMKSDVWEIQNLMREAFGWECGWAMGMEAEVADVENAGGAALNLVIRQDALEAAEILEDKCGTPYHYGAPYGYRGTLNWLREISQIIGQPVDPKLVCRLEEKARSVTPMGGPMGMGMMGMVRPKASIQGDYDLLLGLKQALEELNVDVEHLICSHSLKNVPGANPQVRHFAREKDRLALLQSLEGQWCLGSDEMKRCCGAGNFVTLVSAPFLSHRQWAAHLPFMGEKGMDQLMEIKGDAEQMLGL